MTRLEQFSRDPGWRRAINICAWCLPSFAVLICVGGMALVNCESRLQDYQVAIVGHEAPLDGVGSGKRSVDTGAGDSGSVVASGNIALRVGAGPEADLRTTVAGIEPVHGELLVTGDGFGYRHRAAAADALLLEPGLTGWNDLPRTPRYPLEEGETEVLLIGVPERTAVESVACASGGAGIKRYLLRPVASARVLVADAAGRAAEVAFPLHESASAPVGDLTLRYRDGKVFLDGPAGAIEVPETGWWRSPWPLWTTVEGLAPAVVAPDAVGPMKVARFKGDEHAFIAIGLPDGSTRLLPAPDTVNVLPLPLEADPALSEATLIRRDRDDGAIEVVAHPSPGKIVVRCRPDGAGFKPEPRGTGILPPQGLLLIGKGQRFRTSRVMRPWGMDGVSVPAVQLTPVEKADGFRLLSSVGAGRFFHAGWRSRVPACEEEDGEPTRYLVLRAQQTLDADGSSVPGRETLPTDQAEALARLQAPPQAFVDQVVSGGDQERAAEQYADLPLPMWARAYLDKEQPDAPLLYLCRSGLRHMKVQVPGAVGTSSPLYARRLDTSGATLEPEGEGDRWLEVGWGARFAVGGQLLEVVAGLPRFERWWPIFLLCGLAGAAGLRMARNLRLLVGDSDALWQELWPETPFMRPGLFASFGIVVGLVLLGGILIARMSAHPSLLGASDYFQRTWFSAAVALFVFPAVFALYVADHPQSRWVNPMREIGWAAMAVGGAAFVDLLVTAALLPGSFATAGMPGVIKTLVLIVGLGLGGWLLWDQRFVDVFFPLWRVLLALGSSVVTRMLIWAGLGKALRFDGSAVQASGVREWRPYGESEQPAGPWDRFASGIERLANKIEARWGSGPHGGEGSKSTGDESSTTRDESSTTRDESSTTRDESSTTRDESSTTRDESSTTRDESSVTRDGPEASAELVHPSPWLSRLWRNRRVQIWVGEGGRDVLLVSGAPVFLAISTLIAVVLGGRAENNLTIPILGLGLKLSELGALVLGLAIAALLANRWDPITRVLLRSGSDRPLESPEARPVTVYPWFSGLLLLAVSFGVGFWLEDWRVFVLTLVPAAMVWLILARAPDHAPILVLVSLTIVTTVIAFVAQGDFGPTMVMVPALTALVAYWAISRLRGAWWRRIAIPVALMGAIGLGAILIIALFPELDRWSHRSVARAVDRLLTYLYPWYSDGGDWVVQARWIGAGLREHEVWLANLHSDLAWLGVEQSFGLSTALLTLLLFFLLAFLLLSYARRALEEALRDSADHARAISRPRDELRRAGLFSAFVTFYLCGEVLVHVGTGFNLVPPTGLTLPWVSNGGMASMTYALLVAVALAKVLKARKALYLDRIGLNGGRARGGPERGWA